MAHENELPIPDAAYLDSQSFELLRVWVADNSQHVSVRVRVWNDPAAWGLMLADLARHIVEGFEHTNASDRRQSLQRIRLAFDAELDSPTDMASDVQV